MADNIEHDDPEYRTRGRSETRLPVLTVAAEHAKRYLAMFLILTAGGVGYKIWYEAFFQTDNALADTIHAIIISIAPIGTGAVIASAFTTELWGVALILAAALKDKLKKRREFEIAEGRAKGRAEGIEVGKAAGLEAGREEVSSKWRDWNSRRETAEAEGRTFCEPPPE